MGNMPVNEYQPDYAIPPGETLEETLEFIGMTQAELSERTGRPRKTINEIIKGKTAITPETAIQFERVLGISATFWMNLERDYRTSLARISEYEMLTVQSEWLKTIPVSTMEKYGWIQKRTTPVERSQELLNFFGVASPGIWSSYWEAASVRLKKSHAFDVDRGALSAWLRRGEILSQSIVTQPYSKKKFQKALQSIRSLTTEDPDVFCNKLERLCAEAGVACVFVPELPGTRVSGATRWLQPDKAMIQLSLRYKTNDHLWFSFFHEAAHILLHGKKSIFVDAAGKGESSDEAEANKFAANFLISRIALRAFMNTGNKSKAAISHFAEEQGVAPGIVVGQLQHAKYLPMSHCNDLKAKYEWSN